MKTSQLERFGGMARRGSPGRPRRGRRVWFVVLTLIALAIGTTWVLDQRTKATPFPLESALGELRREATDAPGAGAGSSNLDAGSRPAEAQAPDVPRSGRAGARQAPAGADTSATGGFAVPAGGVYTYATKGGDTLSMLGARHDYPSRTHAVVTSQRGCGWRLEQRVVEEHVDTYTWCSSARGLQLRTLRHDIEFFAQRDSIEYRCPADARFVSSADEAGATHRMICKTAAGDTLDVVVTVTGHGSRTIGSVSAPAITYRADFVMTGKATGTARWEGIIHAATGLRLYEHRVVSTDADAVFGNVHYEEDVTFDLVSLDPAD